MKKTVVLLILTCLFLSNCDVYQASYDAYPEFNRNLAVGLEVSRLEGRLAAIETRLSHLERKVGTSVTTSVTTNARLARIEQRLGLSGR